MRSKTLLVALALMLAVAAQPVAADQGIDFTSVNTNFTNGSWSLGYQFSAGTAINVTHLGFYDDNQDGLSQSHAVGIYDLGGNLLVSATVTNADSLLGFFRYTSIAPTLLNAGQSYIVTAVTGSENYTWNPNGFTTGAGITFEGDRWVSSTSLAFPTNTSGVNGFFGANFQYSSVPEPATALLLGAGLIALGALRRRAA